MTCCGGDWTGHEAEAEATVEVRKVAGPAVVAVPGVRGPVAVGDVVELPVERAGQFVAGGEFAYAGREEDEEEA